MSIVKARAYQKQVESLPKHLASVPAAAAFESNPSVLEEYAAELEVSGMKDVAERIRTLANIARSAL